MENGSVDRKKLLVNKIDMDYFSHIIMFPMQGSVLNYNDGDYINKS